MTMEQKIRAIMKATGLKQMDLAKHFDVSQSTVHRWLKGSEPEGHHRDAINDLYASKVGGLTAFEPRSSIVPVVGYLGAGAEVQPDFEQVPPEGLFEVTVPFDLPDDLLAFEVRGDSMRPVYRDGHIIIVYREQRKPLESFYGNEAAVRTSDGRRFIKTVMRGSNGTVTLSSWNADPIEGQRLEWLGEIFAILPPASVRHLGRQSDNRKAG